MEEATTSEERPSIQIDFSDLPPWGNLLSFIDPKEDASFLSKVSRTRAAKDKWNNTYETVLTICCTVLTRFGIQCGDMGILQRMMLLALVKMYIVRRHYILYRKHRSLFVFLQFTYITISVMWVVRDGIPDMWREDWQIPIPKFGVVALIPLMWSSLAGTLPFKSHVLMQALIATIGWIWVPYSCNMSIDRMSFSEAEVQFSSLGTTITRLLSLSYVFESFTGGSRVKESYFPCWVCMTWFHVMFGFLFPCWLVYCDEAYSRALYLQDNTMVDRHKVWHHWRGTMFLALLALFVLGTASWFITDGIGVVVEGRMLCRVI